MPKMSFAVCVVPVSPLRLEPLHRSEMVSQQLFGESCNILETGKDHWIKVKCSYDGYEGWCQDMHVKEISEDEYPKQISSYTASLMNEISLNGEPMQIPFACPVPSDEQVKKRLSIIYNDDTWHAGSAAKDQAAIRSVAFRFLNTGYLWGGKSIFGIDCSGYTQTVFKLFNVPLLRDAYQQAAQGELVGFLQEARCGDLAFFDNAEGRITHVGILLNDHEIIHSSGKVRLDKIDGQGIINRETGERTHKLRIIKRYF
jgi:gamma-D-glutamyl-L-lysine dipeptidyl-peptidase